MTTCLRIDRVQVGHDLEPRFPERVTTEDCDQGAQRFTAPPPSIVSFAILIARSLRNRIRIVRNDHFHVVFSCSARTPAI